MSGVTTIIRLSLRTQGVSWLGTCPAGMPRVFQGHVLEACLQGSCTERCWEVMTATWGGVGTEGATSSGTDYVLPGDWAHALERGLGSQQ